MNEQMSVDGMDFDFGEQSFTEVTQSNTAETAGITTNAMNIIFLLDTSGSMTGSRINQLNTAMPIALDAAREAALNQEIDLFVRVIEFNSGAQWIVGDEKNGVDVRNITWSNLSASGGTDTASAIRLACTALHTKYLGTRNYHPVVILITDGGSNSSVETHAAIEELKVAMTGNNTQKKDKVWRFAIGVEDYNESELLDFAMIGKTEDDYGNEQTDVPMVFKVDNVANLAKVLKNVTVSSLCSNTQAGGGESGGGEDGPIIAI